MRFGEHLRITARPKVSDLRLDNYLHSRFGQLSRAKLQRIIRSQDIIVNGSRAKPSRKVRFGDIIELDLPSRELLPQDIPLDIIYEDDCIIVLNKKPGYIIHPARGNASGTILNGLVHYAEQRAKDGGAAFVPGVIHRLDRETSGTVIFSKSAEINALVSSQFSGRTVSKEYLALVCGVVESCSGVIDKPIGPDRRDSEKYAVGDDGRAAQTRYRVRERFGGYSLVEVELLTGRTHQIRVHFADMGHPLAGDRVYGGWGDDIMDRVALHSRRLEIDHPESGERMTFESPLPEDMEEAVEYLRRGGA